MDRDTEDLLHDIASGKSAVRRKAAARLAALKDPETVEPLIAMLGHPDFPTHRAIIATLGAIGDARAFDPLSDLLEVPRAYCDELVLAFGNIRDPRSGALLTKLLLEGEVWHAVCAADALGQLKPEGAATSLVKAAKADRLQPRFHALRALATFDCESGLFDDLLPMLDLEDRETIRLAGLCLLRMDEPRASMALRPLLRSGSVDVRRGAAEALAKFGDPDAQRALMTFGCMAF